MEFKPIKLSPKKGGHGHVTSYSVNLGSAEVRAAGFVDADGNQLPIEKIVDTVRNEIVIRLKSDNSQAVSVANQFSGLDMKELISGPLSNAAGASAHLAKSTADFIDRVTHFSNNNRTKEPPEE